MIKNESDILAYIQKNINTTSKNVIKSIGDDCAVIKLSTNKSLVITTDTSLLGPHFTKNYSPYEIGYKCLATNLSDIAAMGCKPKYLLMAITIPKLTDAWIKSFYKGINQLIKKYDLTLIGGDTNKGPLSISFQVIGVNNKKILYRKGAKINDDIYVTGKIGMARAALLLSKNKKEYNVLKKFLHMPTPRISIGLAISNIANCCIDISDGLAKDLQTLMSQSKKGADVFIEKIPTHHVVKKTLTRNKYLEALIEGGEDYELCFTSSKKNRNKIKSLSLKYKTPITIIGTVTKSKIKYLDNGNMIKLNLKGFDHFSK